MTTIDGQRITFFHGKHAEHDVAMVFLPAAHCSAEAFAALTESLRGVGSPVPHVATTEAPGLRWQRAGRTLILQRNPSRVWLELVPSPSADVAEVVAALFDVAEPSRFDLAALATERPGWSVDGDSLHVGTSVFRFRDNRVILLDHAGGADLRQRRAASSALFDAVVGGIGAPSRFGGSGWGPDVRWRNTDRLLVLEGSRLSLWVELRSTESAEDDEHRTFEWGGPFSGSEPSLFNALPYIALVEQIPAQVGRDWFTFTIRERSGAGQVRVSFDDAELVITKGRGADAKRTRFADPDEADLATATDLLIEEFRSWGIDDPADELVAVEVTCADDGWLHLLGLEVGR